MSNERIDFSELEDLQESWEERLTEEGIKEALGHWLFENGNELIAELKRCYEKIDWLQQAADLTADFIGDIHHSYGDRFEERMYEAGLWKRPSEEE